MDESTYQSSPGPHLPENPGWKAGLTGRGCCRGASAGPGEGRHERLICNRPLVKMRWAQSVPSMFPATDLPQASPWEWETDNRKAGKLGRKGGAVPAPGSGLGMGSRSVPGWGV